MTSAGLAGRAVLVTRPAARAAHLAKLLRDAGAEPVLFPTLEILSILDKNDLHNCLSEKNILKYDIVFFISPTAVEQALVAPAGGWQPGVKVAAVGRATAEALRRRGFTDVLAPTVGADSESLAVLPELQNIAGKRVLIIRGEGGRGWLADTLRARGAGVEYLECYRRVRPDTDSAPLAARLRAGGVHAVTMTSREALGNLLDMLPVDCRKAVLVLPIFVVHQRLAVHARALGAARIIVTGAGDDAMFAELQSFFAKVA